MTAPHVADPVRVELADRSYDAPVAGLLRRLGPMLRDRLGQAPTRRHLAVDWNLPADSLDAAAQSLEASRFRVSTTRVEADERRKSLDTVQGLLVVLAGEKHERHDPVIALGGGVVGDQAGFAAAIYRRGVPVVQCPTTLLAMVDAAVGGKTGVNLELHGDAGGEPALLKNFVGAFWQPALVVADTDTLASLPDREYRCGLAECVKHGLIGRDWAEPGLFEWIEQHAAALAAADPAPLPELVRRNIAVKARVVASDERELAPASVGGRALLNLGHTFGHAIETIPGLAPSTNTAHSPLKHGEAVALGLLAACRCAQAMNLAPSQIGDRVHALLTALGLPTAVLGLPATDAVIGRMHHDKKVARGVLRLVLPAGEVGRCRVVDDPPIQAVRAGIEAIRADRPAQHEVRPGAGRPRTID